jgi:anti-sigma factor RsiW
MRWPWRRNEVPGLSCQEAVELVSDYFEGALPSTEAKRFEAHLAECDGCTTYVEQVRRTIELTGRVSEDVLDERTREGLMKTFRDWKQAQST